LLLSKAFIPTQKENPVDAEIPSHRLMLRAGLIRQLTAGVYSYLPMGWRIMKKVMQIIREEMDRIGGQELQMPVLNPMELWEESGRNTDFGDAMFRLKDRRNRALILAPTHEEVICDLSRRFVKSYKDLPQIWYQIQTKFRDEPRPRSGVIRTRQFIMKDSYTLDAHDNGLDEAYQAHAGAYRAIFDRCGLKYHVVGASSGLMGGSGSQEFMVENEFGEDTIALCDQCDYAANLEVALSKPVEVALPDEALTKVHTPGKKTIAEVSEFLKKGPGELIKSLLFVSNNKPVFILIRGDHDVSESKLEDYLGAVTRPAHPEEVREICGAPAGFVGPLNPKKPVRIIADLALQNAKGMTTGANLKDYHFTGIDIARDLDIKEYSDLRTVASGDKCSLCSGTLRVVNTIELGHIFKLGTKYSKSMKAHYLDAKGKERPVIMGSYGIGVERIVAAAIEQNHDSKGIIWNKTLAPYDIHLIPINMDQDTIADKTRALYDDFRKNNVQALMDDRMVSPGFKFKDADLIGLPVQIIIGRKWSENKTLEVKIRRTGESKLVEESQILTAVNEILADS